MTTKITHAWETVTPERAQEFLDQNRTNRPARVTKVREYVTDMEAGNWRETGDPIRFDTTGRLIDGQHRLTAQVQSGVTLVHLVIRGLPPEVQDVLDQGAKRSVSDTLKFNGVKSHTSAIAPALRLLATWDAGLITTAGSSAIITTTNSVVKDLLTKYPEVQDHVAWARRATKDLGLTPAPLAVSRNLMDRVADQATVEEFWAGVEGLEATRPGDPRLALRKWGRNRVSRANGRMDNSIQLFAIFTAWNRWRKGKTMHAVKAVLKAATYAPDTGRQVSPTIYAPIPVPC